MPFLISSTSSITSPANPPSQNPSVAARAPDSHFYRPRGNPFQKLPKAVHSHSHSLSASSIFSSSSCASSSTNAHNSSPQDIVARILARDEIPRGTFMAAEKEKQKAKRAVAPGPVQVHIQQQTSTTMCSNNNRAADSKKAYPERLDSRRALLSVINGTKAPIVFKGSVAAAAAPADVSLPPVPAMPAPKAPVAQQQPQQPQSQPQTMVAAQRVDAVSYLHKQLPPTPPSSNSSKASSHEPSAQPTSEVKQSRALPPVRPLNLELKHNPLNANRLAPTNQCMNGGQETLAKRRFSRFYSNNNSHVAPSRFKPIPAPIKPPRFLGPAAFNGPSSANTSEGESTHGSSHLDLDQEDDNLDLFAAYGGAEIGAHDQLQLGKKVATPMGELPITPLDIPVDWDDLHDRWTSPVMLTHTVETSTLDQLLHDSLDGIIDTTTTDDHLVSDELDLEDAFVDKVVVLRPSLLTEEQEEENERAKQELEREAFAAFQEDVAELFKGSPTRSGTDDWKTEAGSSIRRLTALTTNTTASSSSLLVPVVENKEPEIVTASPISSCSASYGSGPNSSANEVTKVSPCSSTTSLSSTNVEGAGVAGEREKRHGRVLVKKELKLCINIDTSYVNSSAVIDRDEQQLCGEQQQRKKRWNPIAGESFLMMSPESASTRASTILW